jgi:signal transduction histidine kinase
MFLAVFVYQALYFLVQYAVLKRTELVYYSMYLFSYVLYYYAFVTARAFDIQFRHLVQVIFSATQLAVGFLTYYLYTLFLMRYLNITKANGKLYFLLTFFKNYNLAFVLIFLILAACNVKGQSLFDVFSILTIPLTIVCLVKIWGLNTVHANVIIWGTTFTVLGTVCSILLIAYETHSLHKLPFNIYNPNQIGALLDLFILGYGLSLKTAESDKRLVQTLLENQEVIETERGRLAKDLHDGLGGLLSGIKITLSNVQGSVPESNKMLFTKACKQLDTAINEIRRVAHNMMPEALLKFGLGEAIQDFCYDVNESRQVKMEYTQIGSLQMLDQSTEIVLYRIIQELTNNALKHAMAKHIFIQINAHSRGVSIIVEDDGKGFDATSLAIAGGGGLRNVAARVDYVKGSLDINTAKGNGSSISVEVPFMKGVINTAC